MTSTWGYKARHAGLIESELSLLTGATCVTTRARTRASASTISCGLPGLAQNLVSLVTEEV